MQPCKHVLLCIITSSSCLAPPTCCIAPPQTPTIAGDKLVAQCVRGVGQGGHALATERTARGAVVDVLLVALQVGLQPGPATVAALARLHREVHPYAEGDVVPVLKRAIDELCNLCASWPVATTEGTAT